LLNIKKDTKLRDVIKDPKNTKTMLTEWFSANKEYDSAKEFTYCEFPLKWRWDETNKKWIRRQHGFKIGRLYYVNPTEGERFYLRMLLITATECYCRGGCASALHRVFLQRVPL